MKLSDIIRFLQDTITKEGDVNNVGIDLDGKLHIIEGVQSGIATNEYGGHMTVLKFDFFGKNGISLKPIEKTKEKSRLILINGKKDD